MDYWGENRDEYDGEDDDFKVVLDSRDVAKEIAGTQDGYNPQNSTAYAECCEPHEAHPADAGHKRGEGSDDRDETGEDDGDGAVAIVEILGFDKVLFVQKPGRLTIEDVGAKPVAEKVIDDVAAIGGEAEHDGSERKFDGGAGRGERSKGEQERIARQERCNDQARFTENDYENQ